jgi:hypothetical protein
MILTGRSWLDLLDAHPDVLADEILEDLEDVLEQLRELVPVPELFSE